ncbi:MAG: hypothetical protein PHX24_02090 [Acidithiobacillus sp.]|nr:hypothetical protein [Acidithiobacillus sp.]
MMLWLRKSPVRSTRNTTSDHKGCWAIPDVWLRRIDWLGAALSVGLALWCTTTYWQWTWGLYAGYSVGMALTNGTAIFQRWFLKKSRGWILGMILRGVR